MASTISTATDEILAERQGGVGIVTLNRPKALNAFNLEMYRALAPVLRDWEGDDAIGAVIVQGAGGKAFCAGGDIRALWETGPGIKGKDDLKRLFFFEEYQVIRQVHRLKKPYIALINGIAMGGGAGMSINGTFRVATDSTLFAMPETGIALFPDVGATRFLTQCPGRVGLYLGLTGVRLKAADLVYAGLATHYVPAARFETLFEALARQNWRPSEAEQQAGRVLAEFAEDPGPSFLAEHRAAIDRCFAAPSVEAIVAALEAEGGEWAATTLSAIRRASPTSLKVTFRQLERQEVPTIEEALELEFRIVQHVMEGHEFFEGVRAVLVDKDQAPKWRPATLEEVDSGLIDRHFASAGLGGLGLTIPIEPKSA